MMFPLLYRYHSGATVPPNCFFIISTGPESGKPLLQASENCFVVKCTNQNYCQFYFWLIGFLYDRKKFKSRHRAISFEFVNKEEIRSMLLDIAYVAYPLWVWLQNPSK